MALGFQQNRATTDNLSFHTNTIVTTHLLAPTTVIPKRELSSIDLFYTRLFLQGSFSLFIMLICGYKIITAPEADGQKPVYWSVLSSTAASWMPSPIKQAGDDAPSNGLGSNFSSSITKLERQSTEEKDSKEGVDK